MFTSLPPTMHMWHCLDCKRKVPLPDNRITEQMGLKGPRDNQAQDQLSCGVTGTHHPGW